MKKILAISALLIIACVCAHAETIVLRTGARVRGAIVFQNEEVVIVKDSDGARFQYPKADVEAILEEESTVNSEELIVKSEEPVITTSKKASILLEVGGGNGAGVDLLVGSHHIGDRHIFVGGGVGYHGLYVGGTYHFLPIQAAIRLPLIEGKHAPVFGMGVGYGVALSKAYVGGLYAGVDFGYRYQLNPKTALGAVAYVQFQQARVTADETVEGTAYSHETGRSKLGFGAKFCLYF